MPEGTLTNSKASNPNTNLRQLSGPQLLQMDPRKMDGMAARLLLRGQLTAPTRSAQVLAKLQWGRMW
jgi:hypothetical protein